MEVGIGHLTLALAAGAALGVFFYVGLWLTVRRLPASPRPYLLIYGSWLLRTAVTVAAMVAIARIHWQLLVACLAGFVAARVVLTRALGREGTKGTS